MTAASPALRLPPGTLALPRWAVRRRWWALPWRTAEDALVAAIGTPTQIGSLTSGTSTTTYNVTTSGTVPSGATIFCDAGWVCTTAVATASFSGASLTWASDASAGTNGGDRYGVARGYANAPSGATNPTITITLSTAVAVVHAVVYYVTGLATSTPGDGTAVGTFRSATSTSWSAGPITTTNANDILIATALGDYAGSGNTSTPPASYTELYDVESAQSFLLTVTYRIVSATQTSHTATGTWSSAPNFADLTLVGAYKEAAAAGTKAPPPQARRFPLGLLIR